MPQSRAQIYLHVVFATTNRAPLIIDPDPARLHGYLVDVPAKLGCPSLATGGIADHVHILHALGRTRSVAWVMEKVKANSSRWMKQQGAADFWTQPGRGSRVQPRDGRRSIDSPTHFGEEAKKKGE